ncbi:hypothetical protein [Actinoplanes couchii]|uniref:Uncharacterized protein n=1 Tax=Actinoplanes couchii TaxID=403638 RepID=A0ABQ3XB09_9ACTN|nr:hypothetical protein [Actinoplanes couchii]MDR6323191.1 hypothetical protein [Actinoplanes couchii]GID55706.1 hypothetical protein Aco03nite_041100 [Actinoplanes couchii]
MRFFSNEAKDESDEKETTGTSVPQQRAGSPWQHPEPGTAAATPAGTDPDRTVAFADGTPRTEPVQVNPAPDKDGVDLALEDRDDPHATQPLRTGAGEPRHAADKDGIPDGPSDTTGSRDHDRDLDHDLDLDKTGSRDHDLDKTGSRDHDLDKSDTRDLDLDKSSSVDLDKSDSRDFDKSGSRDFDKSDSVDSFDNAADQPGDFSETSSKSDISDLSDKEGDLDRPDAKADEPLIPAAPATPASESTISGPAPFFPSSDTQPLRDRWRDVQLRFVDDPKGATSDASGLVDEAVDKLAKALRDHRGSFAKGTDDTEALRVEFRSYRDILDRLLGL